jgi:hypothetical protein
MKRAHQTNHMPSTTATRLGFTAELETFCVLLDEGVRELRGGDAGNGAHSATLLAGELTRQTADAGIELAEVDALVTDGFGFGELLAQAAHLTEQHRRGLDSLECTLRDYGYATGTLRPRAMCVCARSRPRKDCAQPVQTLTPDEGGALEDCWEFLLCTRQRTLLAVHVGLTDGLSAVASKL